MSDSKNDKSPAWIKEKKIPDNVEIVDCPPYHPIKDYKQDNAGYVLIRVERSHERIEVAVCDYNHIVQKIWRGKRAKDIYHQILKEEKWISRHDHAAYLGKELKKAEFALATGCEYYQE